MKSFTTWRQCTKRQRIARWMNVARVLKKMTPHERAEHFDMGTWGTKTDCGTVACMAGHAGLDPWFRKRGFVMEVKNGYYDVFQKARPWEFFGGEGTDSVFLNHRIHSVPQAIKAVTKFVELLEKGKVDLEG